jgi:HAD superfamily hydrolase (TIGR01549 family)
MIPRFDYVLFDAGGTLLGTNTAHEHWYEQFFVDVCAEQGIATTPGAVADALDAAVRSCGLERRSSSPDQVRQFWEHVYSGCFRGLIPGCDAAALAKHYIDRFETGEFVELFDDALEALELVRSSGLRSGVVSNFGTYLGHFLERTGIAHYFEFALISAAEGCEKPYPEIFERALARAGVEPGRVVFVGDHPREDYEASARHGMFPVLVDRWNRFASQAELRRVRRLPEIAQFLNGR